jgi:hypothetical protein
MVETSLFERLTSDLIKNYTDKQKDYYYEKLNTMKINLSQHHIDTLDGNASKTLQRTRTSSVSVYNKPLVKTLEIKHAFATKTIKEIDRELDVIKIDIVTFSRKYVLF